MSNLVRVLQGEPNTILAVVTALLAMMVGLDWVELTNTQIALVLGFITACLALIRQLVTPNVKLEDDPGE